MVENTPEVTRAFDRSKATFGRELEDTGETSGSSEPAIESIIRFVETRAKEARKKISSDSVDAMRRIILDNHLPSLEQMQAAFDEAQKFGAAKALEDLLADIDIL